MNVFLRPGAAATALAATGIFATLTMGSANAADYCRQDVTGHVTSCSFVSIGQCQAASAGIGGDCFRDPWLQDK